MIIGLCAATAVALTPAVAHASGQLVARYSFDAGIGAGGTVTDDAGGGNTLTVRSAAGGRVAVAEGTAGLAAFFPARCDHAGCPRAILEGPAGGGLNPGRRAFHYGASLLIRPEQTGVGANVLQKGYADRRSQWKLQVDGRQGRPSCVLVGKGTSRIIMARSAVSIVDGAWHQVTCWRTAGVLIVTVDGVERGRAPVPPGLSVDNTLPLRIGGKQLKTDNDQFSGAMDEVFFALD